MEHEGATEDYADELARIREDWEAAVRGHVDGSRHHYEITVVWQCTDCGKTTCQVV